MVESYLKGEDTHFHPPPPPPPVGLLLLPSATPTPPPPPHRFFSFGGPSITRSINHGPQQGQHQPKGGLGSTVYPSRQCQGGSVAGQNGDTPERRHTYHRNVDASITKTATNQIGDNVCMYIRAMTNSRSFGYESNFNEIRICFQNSNIRSRHATLALLQRDT